MRLMRNRLRKVDLYRPVEAASGYVGTISTWEPAGFMMADVQPANNKVLAEQYGQRIENMLTLYAEKGADIQLGYGAFRLLEGEPEYAVVQILEYPFHLLVLVERRGL